MADRDPPPPPHVGEPPLIERARRAGWGLLFLSLVAALLFRRATGTAAVVALVVALSAGALGLLAIGNVMLVRALYRQIDSAADREPDGE